MATLQRGSAWWALSDDSEPGVQARVLVETGVTVGVVDVSVAGLPVLTVGAPTAPGGGTVNVREIQGMPGLAAMRVSLDTDGGPPRRGRTVILVPPDLLVVVDDVESSAPVRWRFHLDSARPPGLGLHARRLDFANGSGAARLYQLAPSGTRLRAEPGLPRAVVETTQPTRTTRFVTVLIAFRTGEPPPVPERLATDEQVGLVHASPAGPRKLLVNLPASHPSDVSVCVAPDGRQVTVS